MGVSYQAVAADRATVVFPAAEGSPDHLTVSYRPNKMTTAWMNDGRKLVDSMPEIVTEWDLTDDDGSPFPLDSENLSRLPITFLGYVLSQLLGDMTTGKAPRPGSSANGS